MTDTTLPGGFTGPLLRPGGPAYDEARVIFNAMIDKRPELIAQCESPAGRRGGAVPRRARPGDRGAGRRARGRRYRPHRRRRGRRPAPDERGGGRPGRAHHHHRGWRGRADFDQPDAEFRRRLDAVVTCHSRSGPVPGHSAVSARSNTKPSPPRRTPAYARAREGEAFAAVTTGAIAPTSHPHIPCGFAERPGRRPLTLTGRDHRFRVPPR
jgi:hypothetical protein